MARRLLTRYEQLGPGRFVQCQGALSSVGGCLGRIGDRRQFPCSIHPGPWAYQRAVADGPAIDLAARSRIHARVNGHARAYTAKPDAACPAIGR